MSTLGDGPQRPGGVSGGGAPPLGERLARLAPLILWPEAAYNADFDQYGSFLRTFYDERTKAVRLHGAQALVRAPDLHPGPKGLNLRFKRGKKEEAPAPDASVAAAGGAPSALQAEAGAAGAHGAQGMQVAGARPSGSPDGEGALQGASDSAGGSGSLPFQQTGSSLEGVGGASVSPQPPSSAHTVPAPPDPPVAPNDAASSQQRDSPTAAQTLSAKPVHQHHTASSLQQGPADGAQAPSELLHDATDTSAAVPPLSKLPLPERPGSAPCQPPAATRAPPSSQPGPAASLEPGELGPAGKSGAPAGAGAVAGSGLAGRVYPLESGQLPEDIPTAAAAALLPARHAQPSPAPLAGPRDAKGAGSPPSTQPHTTARPPARASTAEQPGHNSHRRAGRSRDRARSRSRSRSRSRATSRSRSRSRHRHQRRRRSYSRSRSRQRGGGRRRYSRSRSGSRGHGVVSRHHGQHRRRRQSSSRSRSRSASRGGQRRWRSHSPSSSGVRAAGRRGRGDDGSTGHGRRHTHRGRSPSPSSHGSHGRRRSSALCKRHRDGPEEAEEARRRDRPRSRRRSASRSPSSVSSAQVGSPPAPAPAPAVCPPRQGPPSPADCSDMEVDPLEEGQLPGAAAPPLPRPAAAVPPAAPGSRIPPAPSRRPPGFRPGRRGNAPYVVADLAHLDATQVEWGVFEEAPTDFGALLRGSRGPAAGATPSGSAAGARESVGPSVRPGVGRRVPVGVRGESGGPGPAHVMDTGSGSHMSSGGGPSGIKGAQRGDAVGAVPASGSRRSEHRTSAPAPVAASPAGVAERASTPCAATPERPDVEVEGAGSLASTVTTRVGPSLPGLGPEGPMHPLDDLPFLAASMTMYANSLLSAPREDATDLGTGGPPLLPPAASRVGRPYPSHLLHKLLEDAREIKQRADRLIKGAGAWAPLAVLKYLEAALMFLEVAYGHEQSPDRAAGTAHCLSILDSLTAVTPAPGMLRRVEQASEELLRARRRALALAVAGEAGSGAVDTLQGEVMALRAIQLLGQHLMALALTKALTLRQGSVADAMHTLAPTGGAGTDVRIPAPPAAGTPSPALGAAGRAVRGGAGGAGAGGLTTGGPGGVPAGTSPMPADSASSTLEAAGSVSVGTWRSSLQVLTSAIRSYTSMATAWKAAGAGAGALYAEACRLASGGSDALDAPPMDGGGAGREPEGAEGARDTGGPPAWARPAQTAAAQILCLGYEWGMWDLLGSVTLGRQVLGTILQLPGMGVAQ